MTRQISNIQVVREKELEILQTALLAVPHPVATCCCCFFTSPSNPTFFLISLGLFPLALWQLQERCLGEEQRVELSDMAPCVDWKSAVPYFCGLRCFLKAQNCYRQNNFFFCSPIYNFNLLSTFFFLPFSEFKQHEFIIS